MLNAIYAVNDYASPNFSAVPAFKMNMYSVLPIKSRSTNVFAHQQELVLFSFSPQPFSQLTSRAVILLPAHPASFAHKILFQRVPGCNSIAYM